MRLPLIAWLSICAGPVAAEYTLTLKDIGKRDYYCIITVELPNGTDEPLTEINAFFLNYVGETEVGRSKGASFANVAPGTSATATLMVSRLGASPVAGSVSCSGGNGP